MPPLRAKLTAHRDLILLLGIALLLNFWGITRGLPNVVDWDPDSIIPLGPLVYAKELLSGEPWSHKYPAFHFLVLAGSFAPYLGWLRLTGQWPAPSDSYPYGFTQPEIALSALILIARCISALMAVGTVWTTYHIGKAIFDKTAGLFAGLLLACSPLMIYYAHTGNLDIPYLFWTALAVLMFVRLLQEPAARWYGLLGVFAALAIATKDQAYALFVFIPPALIFLFLRGHLENDVRQFCQRAGLGFLCATGAYLLASNLVFNFEGWLAHVGYITGPATDRYQTYERTLSGYFGLGSLTLTRLIPALNVPVFLCCLSGLICARERKEARMLLVLCVSYVLTFLCVLMYVYPRFVLPLAFLLVPFGGYSLASLWQTGGKAARPLVAAILVYTVSYGFSVDRQFTNDARYQAEHWMATHFPAGTVVGTDAQPSYLPRFPHGVEVVAAKVTPDGVQFADGRIAEYLILSEAHYRRYKVFELTEPAQKIMALVDESLNYEIVAAFDDTIDDSSIWASQLLPYISPTIIILKRF
jgi:hypothetical protein